MRVIYCIFAALFVSVSAQAQTTSYPALTDAQLTQFKQVLTAANAWNELLQYEMQKHSPNPSFAQLSLPFDTTPPAGDPVQTIDHQTVDGNCSVNVVPPAQKGTLQVTDPSSGASSSLSLFTIDINGANCPLTVHATIDGKQVNQDQFMATMDVQAKMLTDEAKKQYDVDDSNMHMDINASLSKNADNSAHIQMGLTLSGGGHSQQQGAFNQSSTMQMAMDIGAPPAGQMFPDMKMNLSEELKYNFPSLNVDMSSTVKTAGLAGPADEHYVINGVAVSKDVYQALRNLIQLPTDQKTSNNTDPTGGQGGGLPGTGGPITAAAPMMCTVDVYHSNDVSKAQLLQVIAAKSSVSAPAILHQTSCSQSTAWPIVDGTNNLLASLQFQTQEIDFNLSLNQNQSNSLTYLPDESSDNADELGGYSFRVKCDVVPACP